MQNHTNSTFYNFTIVGAGASGLWMAYALYKNGLLKDKTLCIVESDTKKENDRTWCYWAREELQPTKMASKVWAYSNYQNQKNSLFPYQYYHIRSSDFYKNIKYLLKECLNIFWFYDEFLSFDERRKLVKTKENEWLTERLFLSSLIDKSGENLFTNKVLSQYLGNPYLKKIVLWQSFIGWRVKTKSPVFDEKKMTMMDFEIPQEKQTQFMYELPFSDNEALIELTRFGKEKLTQQEAEVILKDYLDQKKTVYHVKEVEVGAIIMSTAFDNKRRVLHKDTSVIYLGTIGGAIKPTTGYGFKRMAKYADDIAKALSKSRNLPTMRRKWRFRFYDILLLQILESKPWRGKEIFVMLFKHQPTPKILKFLDEETNIWEEIGIFSKLPIQLFLQSLIQYLR